MGATQAFRRDANCKWAPGENQGSRRYGRVMTKPISFPNFFSPIEGSPAQSLPHLKYHEFTSERKSKKSSFAGIFPWVVAQLVGARSGVLHYLVKKEKRLRAYPPSAPPLLIHNPFSSSLRPSVRPPSSPTTSGARRPPSSPPSPNLGPGPLLPGELR